MKKQLFSSAFTMVELIFVIVILGILASMAVPKFAGVKDMAKRSAELSGAASIAAALEVIHGEWTINEDDFDWDSDGISDDIASELSSVGYPYDLSRNGDDAGAILKTNTKSRFQIRQTLQIQSTALYSLYTASASDPQSGVKFPSDALGEDISNRPDKNDFWLYVIEANASTTGCFYSSDETVTRQLINGDFVLVDVNGTIPLNYNKPNLGINFSITCN